MSKSLSFICLVILVTNAATSPEIGKSSYGNKSKNDLNSNGSAKNKGMQQQPLLLPASTLSLQPYPYYGTGTLIVQEPTYTRVGEIVQKVPTAVSHQSQTVVHNHANVVTPVVAPALRTQVLHTYNPSYVYAGTYLRAPQ